MDDRDAWRDPEVLVVTTETRAALGSRLFLLVFFNALAALMTGLLYISPKPIDSAQVGLALLSDALFLGLTLVFFPLLLGPRGRWEIDLEGITFHACHGTPRRLRWSEVERVRWDRQNARLRAGRATVRLPWHALTDGQAELGRARVAKLLGADFDLTDVGPRSEGASVPKSEAGRWRKPVALGLGTGAVLWAAVALTLAGRYSGRGDGWIVAGWVYLPLAVAYGGALGLAGPVAFRERRARKRAHPDWPWRRRRARPVVGAG